MSEKIEQKQKNISIIELESHPHFIEFLSNFLSREETTFYFSNTFYKKQIDNQFNLKGEIVIQDKDENLTDFIRNHLSNINKTDLTIIATATGSKDVFANKNIEFQNKVLVNVHNINEWFNLDMFYAIKYLYKTSYREKKHKKLNLINIKSLRIKATLKIDNNFILIRLLRTARKTFQLFREKKKNNIILSKAGYINVFHPQMKSELEKKHVGSDKYKITNLPYRYPISYKNDLKDKPYLCLGFLGTIKRSRDYYGFLQALKSYSTRRPKSIKLKFLGMFKDIGYQNEILELIYSIEDDYIFISNMPDSERVNQRQIDEQMEDVDLIVSPITISSIDRKSTEVYGVTRASGIDFDAFYYGKPLLVPSWYTPVYYLADMYDYYDNYSHLNELISKYMDFDVLKNKTREVREINNIFTWDKIREDFYEKVFKGI